MENGDKLLLAIGGATGSGKTNLAIKLAKRYPQLVVLSADSRQVYKYLNVGTAKIGTPAFDYRLTGKAEPVRIAGGKSQFLIDIAEPNTFFTLADFQKEANRLIKACWDQGRVPLLVGGTGLYLQAVVEGYVLHGAASKSVRSELERLTVAQLQKKLADIGETVPETDKKNKRRLIRAIERGQDNIDTIKIKKRALTKNTHVFVLDHSWEAQRSFAPAMVKERLDLGLVDEVKVLLKTGVEKDWLRGMGLSYRLVIDMLDGNLAEGKLEERMTHEFRQLMRRQRTWFNRMPQAKKLPAEKIAQAIKPLLD